MTSIQSSISVPLQPAVALPPLALEPPVMPLANGQAQNLDSPQTPSGQTNGVSPRTFANQASEKNKESGEIKRADIYAACLFAPVLPVGIVVLSTALIVSSLAKVVFLSLVRDKRDMEVLQEAVLLDQEKEAECLKNQTDAKLQFDRAQAAYNAQIEPSSGNYAVVLDMVAGRTVKKPLLEWKVLIDEFYSKLSEARDSQIQAFKLAKTLIETNKSKLGLNDIELQNIAYLLAKKAIKDNYQAKCKEITDEFEKQQRILNVRAKTAAEVQIQESVSRQKELGKLAHLDSIEIDPEKDIKIDIEQLDESQSEKIRREALKQLALWEAEDEITILNQEAIRRVNCAAMGTILSGSEQESKEMDSGSFNDSHLSLESYLAEGDEVELSEKEKGKFTPFEFLSELTSRYLTLEQQKAIQQESVQIQESSLRQQDHQRRIYKENIQRLQVDHEAELFRLNAGNGFSASLAHLNMAKEHAEEALEHANLKLATVSNRRKRNVELLEQQQAYVKDKENFLNYITALIQGSVLMTPIVGSATMIAWDDMQKLFPVKPERTKSSPKLPIRSPLMGGRN